MTRRGAGSVVASPVLVGAVTVLVAIVAVFLAYNANQGLPFVPTYNLGAEVPSGDKLVKGNEVRVGGFRVGVVDQIRPKQVQADGESRTVAVIEMKLDKTVEPLAKDTTVFIRPRSALGLKYVEMAPGKSKETFVAGDVMPLRNAKEGEELEDVFSTFDEGTRDNSRVALEGFGDAFAGRGPSVNEAIGALNPLFTYLTPVMSNLSDPGTELDEFFKQIGRASAQVAPIAGIQAELFTNMADTFDAIGRDPRALQATIEKSPPTLDTAISSLHTQRPFLANFADLSHRLRPAARQLPKSLPALTRAFRVGSPVLLRSVDFNNRTGRVFLALKDLTSQPETLLAIRDLRTTTAIGRPLLEYVAPYQTVCNYFNYFFTPLGGHFGAVNVPGGTGHAVLVNSGSRAQDNAVSVTSYPDRPADVPADFNPKTAKADDGEPLQVIHAQPYAPAIDAQGNADCQNGQTGYLTGPLGAGGRYPAAPLAPGESYADWAATKAGGSHVVVDSDTPGLAGPTFTGVKNLKDVP